MKGLFATVALVGTVWLGGMTGCGDDEGGSIDAAVTIDAPGADAPEADASQQSACMALCECATTYCGSRFPDMAACLTDCEGLSASARSCRITHCGYAQSDATTHCPHVAGEDICD